jgi:hypothetical protein
MEISNSELAELVRLIELAAGPDGAAILMLRFPRPPGEA